MKLYGVYENLDSKKELKKFLKKKNTVFVDSWMEFDNTLLLKDEVDKKIDNLIENASFIVSVSPDSFSTDPLMQFYIIKRFYEAKKNIMFTISENMDIEELYSTFKKYIEESGLTPDLVEEIIS